MIKRLFRRLKAAFNYACFSEHRFRRVVRRHLLPYYTDDAPRARNERKQVILMFDGRKRHGGLADRLRGITTTYCYCREHGLDFRLHFVVPFRLEEFLEPNCYDWRIAPEAISYNRRDARPVYIASQDLGEERDKRFLHRMADKFLAARYRQLHLYTNMYFHEDRFGEAFRELFRPAAWLQRLVDEQVRQLGGARNFTAVSSRFLEALGDFNEHRDRAAQPLPPAEQELLLGRCCEELEHIHAANPGLPVLVTSDSARFLERAAAFDFVRVLPGRIGHMDVAGSEEREVHTKTFLDFLVLAEARSHYYLVGKGMYRGNFSRRAAQIGGAPFYEVTF